VRAFPRFFESDDGVVGFLHGRGGFGHGLEQGVALEIWYAVGAVLGRAGGRRGAFRESSIFGNHSSNFYEKKC
jgi:hypothetical protein